MRREELVAGVALLGVTVLAWGATFPVAKSALVSIDGFWVTAIRYTVTPFIYVLILAAVERRAAFDYGGHFWLAAAFGFVGYGGFNFFAFVGLQHTLPEHAAIVGALQAPLTAIAHWVWRGVRPANFTLACIAAAIVGVVLVVTKGDPGAAVAGGSLFGDLLVLLGAMCWVAYVLGVVRFSDWSALRYAALTSLPAGVAILAVTLAATAMGVASVPGVGTVVANRWELGYLILITGVVGVVCWNGGIRRVGPLNATLMLTLVPVVTFAIRIAQGHRFSAMEIGGASLVVGALIANNLYLRSRLTALQQPSGNPDTGTPSR